MATDQKKNVLGVDLDGVCADFYGRIREIAAEWFEKPLKDLTPDGSSPLFQTDFVRSRRNDGGFDIALRSQFPTPGDDLEPDVF
jgi:hypothetical protein